MMQKQLSVLPGLYYGAMQFVGSPMIGRARNGVSEYAKAPAKGLARLWCTLTLCWSSRAVGGFPPHHFGSVPLTNGHLEGTVRRITSQAWRTEAIPLPCKQTHSHHFCMHQCAEKALLPLRTTSQTGLGKRFLFFFTFHSSLR